MECPVAWVGPPGLLDPCFVSNKGGGGRSADLWWGEFTSSRFVDYFMAVIAHHCVTPMLFLYISVATFVTLQLLDFDGKMRVIFVLALPACLSTNPYSYSRPLPRPNKARWRKNGLIPKSESLDKTPRWFSEGSEGNIWKLKMEDRHKNRIQDNLSFLVKVWQIWKLSKKMI